MFSKRIYAYIPGIVAVVSFILAVIARLACTNKALLGVSALSYLRITNTMLLFALTFILLELRAKKG